MQTADRTLTQAQGCIDEVNYQQTGQTEEHVSRKLVHKCAKGCQTNDPDEQRHHSGLPRRSLSGLLANTQQRQLGTFFVISRANSCKPPHTVERSSPCGKLM